uniref:Uncharacterized protein n=1 Tax=Oryza nivara TaxID=4536 RepID=A0A0E0I2L7_ORYNI
MGSMRSPELLMEQKLLSTGESEEATTGTTAPDHVGTKFISHQCYIPFTDGIDVYISAKTLELL